MRKVIQASEGMTLTNGEAFGKIVYLVSGADASDWYEIADELVENYSTFITGDEFMAKVEEVL